MRLDQLPRVVQKGKKRVGRGYGSGKGGHTVGRGQKGQKSRSKIHPLFEGTKNKKSLFQRLPLLRGKGRFKPSGKKQLTINVKDLNILPEGTTVDLESLVKAGIVGPEARGLGIKVLGNGDLEKKLIVKVSVTRGAIEKIKAAGGEIQVK